MIYIHTWGIESIYNSVIILKWHESLQWGTILHHIAITIYPFKFMLSHLPKPLFSILITFYPHFIVTTWQSWQSKTIVKCMWKLVRLWLRYSVLASVHDEHWYNMAWKYLRCSVIILYWHVTIAHLFPMSRLKECFFKFQVLYITLYKCI